MINDTIFQRFAGFPIKELTLEMFWAKVNKSGRLYVRTKTERDYFLGMQIIEGKSFLVFMEDEELDHIKNDPQNTIWRHRFYTNDPVNKP